MSNAVAGALLLCADRVTGIGEVYSEDRAPVSWADMERHYEYDFPSAEWE